MDQHTIRVHADGTQEIIACGEQAMSSLGPTCPICWADVFPDDRTDLLYLNESVREDEKGNLIPLEENT